MIGIITLDENFKNYSTKGGGNSLGGFEKVNIFIGPNNSGKSWFMRTFLTNTSNIRFVTNGNLQEANRIIEEINAFVQKQIKDRPGIEKTKGAAKETLRPLNASNYFKQKGIITNFLLEYGAPVFDLPFTVLFKNFFTEIYRAWANVISPAPNSLLGKMVYIPVLRGLRPVAGNTDPYVQRTKNDYFDKLELKNTTIFSGQKLNEEAKELLLGSSKDRLKIKQFEQFLSETFFEGKEISIIPKTVDDVVHIKIGEEEDKKIYQLGDGIQQIIILIYPLFFAQEEELLVFFEEPDLFLHPGYQRIFFETLHRAEFKKHQFFLTTHSNHFLDMSMDFDRTSIHSFKKTGIDQFEIETLQNGDTNILSDLGVRNSSVFLTNCTIWVEGITDRIYIRKYLELYQASDTKLRHFLEDRHYAFVEFSGGNITHWAFLNDQDSNHPNMGFKNLCGKIFLFEDNDNAIVGSAKWERHEFLKGSKEIKYHLIETREIENLLEPEILKATLKTLYKKDEDYIDTIEFKKEAYQTKEMGMGTYLESVLTQSTYKVAKGTTINNKLDFAKNAVASLTDYSQLSAEAQELTDKIYKFIARHNQNASTQDA